MCGEKKERSHANTTTFVVEDTADVRGVKEGYCLLMEWGRDRRVEMHRRRKERKKSKVVMRKKKKGRVIKRR